MTVFNNAVYYVTRTTVLSKMACYFIADWTSKLPQNYAFFLAKAFQFST